MKYVDPDGRKMGMPNAAKQMLLNHFIQRDNSITTNVAIRKSLTWKGGTSFYGVPPEFKSTLMQLENRRTRITQNDIKFPNPQGPCFFRSLQAVAEEKMGINLNYNQFYESFEYLQTQNVVTSTYYVLKPAEVIKDAFIRLGAKNIIPVVSDYKRVSSNENDYTIRNIFGNTHYQLGKADGSFLWEPYKYNNPRNIYKGEAGRIREVKIWFNGVINEN